MSVVEAIAVLAVLVLVHEAGHFAVARALGIRVSQFSVGFGPALWSVRGREVEYAVRAIPLGGYVGFPEDPAQPDDPDLLPNRPVGDRVLVMGAGVAANLALALLLCVVTGFWGGVVAAEQPGIRVVGLTAPTAPAAIAGLEPGDIIQSVDGQTLSGEVGVLTQFQRWVADRPNRPLRLTVERQGSRQEVTVVPVGLPNQARIGVTLDYVGPLRRQPAPNPVVALRAGWARFADLLGTTLQGLAQLVVDLPGNAQRVAGPVAIVAAGAEMARSGWLNLLEFAAMVSINLAVVNLLPLPALDGGQLLFLAIEALGRPLSPSWQQNVMQGGLVLLLGLGAVTLVRDSWGLLNQTGLF